MGLEGTFIIIEILIAMTIAYFLIGLFISFFVGTIKTFFYAFVILLVITILIVAFSLQGSSSGTDLLSASLGLGIIFLVFPTITLFLGMVINDLIRNISKK